MKQKIILIIIIIFAFILRIYQTNTYTPLNWDETALGYNAYSILKTGKDEYGVSFPLIFKSFGDYKPGVYVYLDVPFIAIFGLNPISVRLPSIILGSLIPLLMYFFIKHFSPKGTILPTISAFIVAINPWNIHFSRAAWETNILLFELLFASLLFIKNKYFASGLIFAISLYTYQSAKLLSLFVLLSLFTIQYKHIISHKIKISTNFLLPLFLFSLPLIYGLIFSQDSNRLQVLSAFSYPRSAADSQQIISESSLTDYRLFHNQLFYLARITLSHYLNYFSPKFLLTDGDWQNARHSPPYTGILLFPSFFFLLIGLFKQNNKYQKLNLFFLLWLILMPIPAALTRDTIQAVRSLPMSIPYVYFVSLGIYEFYLLIKKTRFKSIYISAFCFMYMLSLAYYLDLYYNHMVKKTPTDFLYGYQQVMSYVLQNQSKYNQIYISDFYGQPYIYYLFFSRYSPSKYQPQAKLVTSSVDVGSIKKIDNLNFIPIDWPLIQSKPKTLTIISLEEVRRLSLFSSPQSKNLIPLSPIGDLSIFYAYITP